MDKWETTAPVVVVSIAGLVALTWLILWAVDYAAVHRTFGETPGWYWRPRHDFLSFFRGLLNIPQMITLTGIGFVLLGMWAYAHPHDRTVDGMRGEISWYPRDEEFVAKFSEAGWHVQPVHSRAKELKYDKEWTVPDEKYGEVTQGEGVSITVRPYWAKHIWPRTFYRLEVSYPSTDKLLHPDAGPAEEGKNPRLSYYHGVEAKMFFDVGDKTVGPIIAEQAVDSYHAVSYDGPAISKLLDALKASGGPLTIRIEFRRDGKLLDQRTIVTPTGLNARAIDILTGENTNYMRTIIMGRDDHE